MRQRWMERTFRFDMRQPDAKDKLRETFAAAHVPAEIEVYSGALHGWCVPDMPLQNGQPIYNKPDAERAWGNPVSQAQSCPAGFLPFTA